MNQPENQNFVFTAENPTGPSAENLKPTTSSGEVLEEKKPVYSAMSATDEPNKTNNSISLSDILPKTTMDQCRKAMTIVRKAVNFSLPSHPAKLLKSAEELIAIQAWLVGELLTAESKYRAKVELYRASEWNKKNSVTTAETKAKAESEYIAYKFLSYVYDLAGEQILLVKKFLGRENEEYYGK